MENIHYPVFLLDRKSRAVYVCHSESQLSRMKLGVFRQTNFSGMTLVDSSGVKRIIKSVYAKGGSGFRNEAPGEGTVTFKFNFLDAGCSITLEEIKAILIEYYARARWIYALFHGVEDFREKLERCETIQQISDLIDRLSHSSI